MALIKCVECGAEVSDRASACVHCGCPINTHKDNMQQDNDLSVKVAKGIKAINTVSYNAGVSLSRFIRKCWNEYNKE